MIREIFSETGTRTAKKLIRDLLPARPHNALRRAVHGRRLARVPAMAPDVAPLPGTAEISSLEMPGDDSDADGWERARTSIHEVCDYVHGDHAIDRQSARALYHLIRRFRPRSVLEIGTAGGASTLHIAMAMTRAGGGDGSSRLVTVDLWDVNDPAVAAAKRYRVSTPPREMLARLDRADMVEFAAARSTDYLDGHPAAFDFIFMDHAPSADVAYRDIVLATRALRPGGHVLIHSYFPGGKPLGAGRRVDPGSWLAVRRLRREGAGLAAVPLGRPAGAGGSNRLASLALLARE